MCSNDNNLQNNLPIGRAYPSTYFTDLINQINWAPYITELEDTLAKLYKIQRESNQIRANLDKMTTKPKSDVYSDKINDLHGLRLNCTCEKCSKIRENIIGFPILEEICGCYRKVSTPLFDMVYYRSDK